MKENLLAQFTTAVGQAGTSAAEKASESTSVFLDTLLSSLDIFKNVLLSILIIGVFYLIGKLLARRVIRGLRHAKGESLYPDMVILIQRFSVVGSLFVGIAVAVQFVFKLDFIQVIGFFGLGISFAFKDLLSNLIAGAVIVIQNRIHIGDFIQIGTNGTRGKIKEIQTRTTILKGIDGTEIIIPNADLLVKQITNYTAHRSRRITFTMRISFESDITKAKEIILRVLKVESSILLKPKPQVILQEVGDSFINLNVRFWMDPQDKSKSWVNVRSERIQAVKEAFDKENIIIPFPIEVFTEKAKLPKPERA
ncbi:MAG: mechanosensitive ion channel [bacterium]|nr:mechanosensitive ion channel [bacterium]